MTPPVELAWSWWLPKPVLIRQVQFTGFEDGGNGWDILSWLHDRGIEAYGDPDGIHLTTNEREEALAPVGHWFVIGTQGEVYPISDAVHNAKYEAAAS